MVTNIYIVLMESWLLLEVLASFDDKAIMLMTWPSSGVLCLLDNALCWHSFSEINNYETPQRSYFDHYLSHMKITPGYHWNAASLDVVFEMDKNNHWCISIPSNRCGPPLIGQYIDQMWSLRWTETIKDVLQSHPTFVAHLQSDNVLMYTSYVVVLLMHQR